MIVVAGESRQARPGQTADDLEVQSAVLAPARAAEPHAPLSAFTGPESLAQWQKQDSIHGVHVEAPRWAPEPVAERDTALLGHHPPDLDDAGADRHQSRVGHPDAQGVKPDEAGTPGGASRMVTSTRAASFALAGTTSAKTIEIDVGPRPMLISLAELSHMSQPTKSSIAYDCNPRELLDHLEP